MAKPNQNELHSGHNKGRLIKGILATVFLTGLNISEKLHIYETESDKQIK
jgi:hypothetical protein